MRPGVMLALAMSLLAGPALAQDPAGSDGDKYKVVLENEEVRVLEYKDLPGEKTHQHLHPKFVVVAVQPFKRRLTLGDGRVLNREFKAGDVLYSNGETHVGENIGSTPTHVIMIEMKASRH